MQIDLPTSPSLPRFNSQHGLAACSSLSSGSVLSIGTEGPQKSLSLISLPAMSPRGPHKPSLADLGYQGAKTMMSAS